MNDMHLGTGHHNGAARRLPNIVDAPQQLKHVIGRQIRRTRELAGQPLSSVALAAGISVSFLSRLEHGHNIPSLDTLHRIAIALNTPMASLVDPNCGEP